MGGGNNMKKLILVVTAVMFALSLGLGAAVAKDAPGAPVKVSNFGKKKVVEFDHAKHKDLKCDQCHHKGMDEPKCGACHKLDDGDAPKIKDAMHGKDKGSCYECHLQKDADKKLKCADCHAH